jgi:transposase
VGELERSLKEKDETLAMYVGPHQVVWRSARDQVEALEQALEVQKTPFAEQLERLQTVPGVGPIVATTAVAVFSDIRRFPAAKHAASYSGVVPSTHQSGDRDAHGRITQKGSGELQPCCAKRLITRRAPIIRSTPTSGNSVRSAGTEWP